MKRITRNKVLLFWGFVFLVMMLVFVVFICNIQEKNVYNISIGEYSETINSWSAEDNISYLILPSFVKEIDNHEDELLYLDEDISTLFINTSTGSMESVYNKKSNKERIRLLIADGNGKETYYSVDGKIKGHGNTTWDSEDKKSFKLIFEENCNLIGNSNSSEWVLLSNSRDYSSLRNKIAIDTAAKAGYEERIEGQYVNVYLNGDYNGLYLLSPSVKSEFKDSESEILCNSELAERVDDGDKAIKLSNGIMLLVHESATEYSMQNLTQYIKDADKTVTDNNAKISDYFDLNSWAEKYLLDEIFENLDAGITSNYFYLNTLGDGFSKIYGGPIWDYDTSMGNEDTGNEDYTACITNTLFAANYYRGKNTQILWYKYLYDNEDFYDILVDKYKNIYRPLIMNLINQEIDRLDDSITLSRYCNDLLWGITEENRAEGIKEFFRNRLDFLDSLWLDKKEYHMVTVDHGYNMYFRVFVEDGKSILETKNNDRLFKDDTEKIINKSDNSTVSLSEPIYSDLEISVPIKKTQALYDKLYYNRKLIIALGFFGILLLVMLILIIREIKVRKYE